ncbi:MULTISPECIES: hypothetical protein [unclassified Mesorhizobium]|uniref:hypothetical protein n=1 Tax=unclassified Mesorhizobium TaxID=325217 RepID=UPI0015E44FF2|nr:MULTISPECIES: hypothetical protein [unclassified Mesorhizobium]MBZ9917451.1 hypothetical protein [Mesorhizobium sp. BR1-1-7]MBZ9955729.1 hypothetical protein [Mesorhizobium sp. BR1-1-15]MBZ9968008.1 hypothetical protein [Mesorhizobium sp. BR1-1-12]MCA0028853.1 hypothetical protein [Mesorhizobium sp. B263B1A]UCI14552.1 hypothetical protein FJ972_06670 [Mesorhizobium sp. B2-1-1]
MAKLERLEPYFETESATKRIFGGMKRIQAAGRVDVTKADGNDHGNENEHAVLVSRDQHRSSSH